MNSMLASGVLVLCILSGSTAASLGKENGLTLSVIHFNDFHARYEEVSPSSGVCKPNEGVCHGGIARMTTVIKELMLERENPILINAGDTYQGTLYYNVFKWNITQQFMNALPITAHTIGNHEFDDKVAGLVPYLKSLTSPVIVSNINDTFHPEIHGLYKKSTIITVDGKKIGFVGVILSTTNELSKTENIIFMDEVECVNKEADRLIREGVFTVIVVSHCGYDVDQEIAKGATKHIGLIVGAHTHTLLYNGTTPDNSTARGPYPTVVERDVDGGMVLVVQAASYTKYLGDIVVHYDENGEVDSYSGSPIYLSSEIEKDPEMVAMIKPFKAVVDAVGSEILGETKVVLDQESCSRQECNFGDFVTDAMVFCSRLDTKPGSTPYVSLAFTNPASIRTSIPIGNITYNDLMVAQPFENTYDVGTFTGENIKTIFETTATPYNFRQYGTSTNLLQVSGFKITYDLSQENGKRVKSIQVKNLYTNEFEDLQLEQEYRVKMNSFLTSGGDGFGIISDSMKDIYVGEMDVDCLKAYIKNQSPIEVETNERLIFLNHLREVKEN